MYLKYTGLSMLNKGISMCIKVYTFKYIDRSLETHR